jgi:dihydroxyacetone kinase phosphoprotein-dependent L subunit
MTGEINAKQLVRDLVAVIEENKAWLSEIDGAVGDGDHGINMAKGFSMVGDGLDGQPDDLGGLLSYVGMTLVTHIGGAMGPIYGTFFMKMGKAIKGKESLEASDISNMLAAALEGVVKRGGAEVGDKTLVDTLSPATQAFNSAVESGSTMEMALDEMMAAAKRGMESTKDMVARKGRSSRLGERSRGTIDAGSASCYLILTSMGENIKRYL